MLYDEESTGGGPKQRTFHQTLKNIAHLRSQKYKMPAKESDVTPAVLVARFLRLNDYVEVTHSSGKTPTRDHFS